MWVLIDFQGSGTPDSMSVYLFKQEDGQPACAGIDAGSLPFPVAKSTSVSCMVQAVVGHSDLISALPDDIESYVRRKSLGVTRSRNLPLTHRRHTYTVSNDTGYLTIL